MGNISFRLMVICAAAVVFAASACTAQTNSAAATNEPVAWTEHVVQSYQDLQDKQQATLRAIEQARQDAAATARAIEQSRLDAEASSKRNTEAIESRLNRIEEAITTQRQKELDSLQSSHRFTLIVVGIFAGVGFFGMLFFAMFLLRAMSRRGVVAPAVEPIHPQMGQPFVAGALGSGETQLAAAANRVEQSSAQFLSAIQRLENRIKELESTTEPAPKPPSQPSPVAPTAAEKPPQPAPAQPVLAADHAARVSLLMGKGQALLNLQQADGALACFDEVIAVDATNAEAFVKKGAALERLGRLDEAIDCYDRAIALDTSMTMAYLNKGGVFNRLERYGEALQCYEQALRAQQKPRVS